MFLLSGSAEVLEQVPLPYKVGERDTRCATPGSPAASVTPSATWPGTPRPPARAAAPWPYSTAYFRASTNKQEASIPSQRKWARRVAHKERITLLAEFEDEGVVGDEITHRAGLQTMLAYCEDRFRADDPLDVLLLWDTDRLARASSIRTAGGHCPSSASATPRMVFPSGVG